MAPRQTATGRSVANRAAPQRRAATARPTSKTVAKPAVRQAAAKPVMRQAAAKAPASRRSVAPRGQKNAQQDHAIRSDMTDTTALEIASLRLDAYALLAEQASGPRSEAEEVALLNRAALLTDWALYTPRSPTSEDRKS
jgi:hypothetical protein